MSLVTVEARGKGGAANGGGNSWRGGNQLSLSSSDSLIAAVFLHSPEDQRHTDGWETDGAALWTWIIIAVISTLVLGTLICLFYKTYISCKVSEARGRMSSSISHIIIIILSGN